MPPAAVIFVIALLALVHAQAQAQFGGSLVADYVIVGGGGAGCVLAHDLAAAPANYKVVLLERGIVPFYDATIDTDTGTYVGNVDGPFEHHYWAIPQTWASSRQVYVPTFEGIGGGTRIYGATTVVPSATWWNQKMPTGYKYNDVLPVIKSWQDHFCNYLPESYTGISPANCQAYHGKGGPMSIGTQDQSAITQPMKDLLSAASSVIGFNPDYNGASRPGASWEQNFKTFANASDPTSFQTKLSTWAAFLPQSFRNSHPNLEIQLGATVNRLLYSLFEPTRVIGVEYNYIASDGSAHVQSVYALREVIVSLGALGTPRFLQANGIGPADLLASIGVPLRANNPAVGANLTTHQGAFLAYKFNSSLIHNATGHWSNNVLDFFIKSNYTTLPADIQVSLLEGVYAASISNEESNPGLTDLFLTIKSDEDNGNYLPLITSSWEKYVGCIVFNVDPSVTGWVNATGPDVTKNPTLDYGWNEAAIDGSGDLLKIANGFKVLRQIFLQTPGFSDKYDIEEIVPGQNMANIIAPYYPQLSGAALQAKVDEIHLRNTFTHFYHVHGSCRLGNCVDLDGRVNGVQRLRVCDNSLLPSPDGNPTSALITVCREIASRILADSTDGTVSPQYTYF